jgi:Leucine-rich repeat (LRR) protein
MPGHVLADDGGTPITVPDSGLYDALYAELGDCIPTEENMATLGSLYADSGSYTISDLTGLEYAFNLTDLDLYGQSIFDYSPISSLPQLQYLYLGDNFNLSDLSFLSGLDLYELDISYCNVSDLTPLEFMFSLFSFYASGNNISDISPLDGLSSLEDVSLDDNNISDFSPLLSAFYTLFADLSNNNISDISPAVDFSDQSTLYLDDNLIEDFSSLKNDVDLPYISLYGNPINEASFCHILPIIEANNYVGVLDFNTGLHNCNALASIPDAALKSAIESELSIIDPTINDMAGLQYLYADSSGIIDLTGLELAVNLLELNLYDNSIVDISPIQHLCQLEYLDLSLNNLNQNSFCTVLPQLEANNPLLVDGSTLFTDANPFTCPTSGHFIPDVNLRLLVQNELGLPGEPTQGDMVNLFHLWERFAGGPESSKVTDLTGLEFATNLVNLDLSDHNVSSLAPLSGLLSLNGLYMSDNNLTTIAPLSTLNLQFLYITFNSNVSSISAVSSMSNLRYLGCGWCNIGSISPVSGLSQLIELQIDYNPVTDLTPMYGLLNLTRLGLGGLGLTDISFLSTWPNLNYLALSSNPLTDLSSLSQFTSLTSLYFYSMTISDISFLNSLTSLVRMGFAHGNVSDISPVASLTALKSLFAYNNQFSNIAPLTSLTNLESCLIYNNPLNPLAYCSHAATIQANNPNLTNFNFGTNTNPLSSDCTTDLADLNVVTGNWGRTDCTAVNNWCDGADFNMDGKVDLIDYVNLAMIWMAIP